MANPHLDSHFFRKADSLSHGQIDGLLKKRHGGTKRLSITDNTQHEAEDQIIKMEPLNVESSSHADVLHGR